MANKYYTPTIEEFHVGFEYWFSSAYQEGVSATEITIDGRDGYEPMVYDLNRYNFMSKPNKGESYKDIFELMLSHNQIKVKYLDKEDIESLGWRNVEDRGMSENYGYSFEKPIQYLSGGNAYYRLRYWFTNHRVRIEPLGGPIFEGTIKNKSELKVLLEQLGI